MSEHSLEPSDAARGFSCAVRQLIGRRSRNDLELRRILKWRWRLLRSYLVGAGLLSALACSGTENNMELGRLSMPLEVEVDGTIYSLNNATFRIEGPQVELVEPEPSVQQISLPLAAGDYQVELMPGWELHRRELDEWVTTPARLLSPNPQLVSVPVDETATVGFRFEAAQALVSLGEGALAIVVDVTVADGSPQLVINEVLRDPTAVGDSAGEWVEVLNAGLGPVDLASCALVRDDRLAQFQTARILQAGELAVLANSSEPGFAPDGTYSGLTLPNSAVVALELRCDDSLVDSVVLDPSDIPAGAGHSWSLDPAFATPQSNDGPTGWCAASVAWGADYGTPGQINPPCVAE